MLRRFVSQLRDQWMGALALFLVLSGGTAYAVTQIDKNSVKSKHIVDGQVRSPDVEDNGLTGVDINESSLGSVPFAEEATTANSAVSAGNADTVDSMDSNEFAEKGSEAWTPPTFNDGSINGQFSPHYACRWANYGGGHSPAGYFRDPAGVVHLRGVVRATSGFQSCGDNPDFDHAIWTLPAGYRPSDIGIFPVVAFNSPGRASVRPNGEVRIEPGFPEFGAAQNWVSLDGITFRCAPVGETGCP